MTEAIRVGWLLLLIVMLAHQRLRIESVAERAPGTWLGIFTQALGFSVIWTLHREGESLPPAAVAFRTTIADACGLAAVVLGLAAIWTLGRQWSVEGRLLPEHRLVLHGPYAYVRHPIYTSMFGMLLATGLSTSSIVGLGAGTCLFVVGTVVRVHYEENLLRKQFGVAFQQYSATVPAFLPWIGPGGTRRGRGLPEPSSGTGAQADEAADA